MKKIQIICDNCGKECNIEKFYEIPEFNLEKNKTAYNNPNSIFTIVKLYSENRKNIQFCSLECIHIFLTKEIEKMNK